MPTIYNWQTPQQVSQERYNTLITRPGWFATPTAKPVLDKDVDDVSGSGGGGSLPLTTAIAEGTTFKLTRALLADPNTAADVMEALYNGARVFYLNEYGELRVIAAKDNTVAVRIKQRSGTHTGNLTEWCDISNNILAAIDKDGKITAPNLGVSAWVDVTLAAHMSQPAGGSGYANVSVRKEYGSNIVRMRGRFDANATAASGIVSATVPAGYRPATTHSTIVRHSSAGALLTVNTDGTITIGQALSAGQFVYVGGITWPLD